MARTKKNLHAPSIKGVANMTDKEFINKMWENAPTAEDIHSRNKSDGDMRPHHVRGKSA